MDKQITIHKLIPGNGFHPGVFLAEELQARGISPAQCAKELGLKPIAMNLILRGRRGLSPEIVMHLEHFLDTPAEFWMAMQSKWDTDKVRIRLRSRVERSDISTADKTVLIRAI